MDILKAAAKSFRRLGYHGATVEQIAAALQMKKGNLYYYYRNKEEILFACHQYSLDQLTQLLDEVNRSEGNPKLLAFALFGAVNWIPRWFNPEGPASSQQIADLFADFFIRGLTGTVEVRSLKSQVSSPDGSLKSEV